MKKITLVGAVALTALNSCQLATHPQETESENFLTMLVGTYTDSDSKGLYSFYFNQKTGDAQCLDSVVMPHPSYVISRGPYVYAVSEGDTEDDAVYAFALDKDDGALTYINHVKTQGKAPCHLTANEHFLVTANYNGGSLSIFGLNADGSLREPAYVFPFSGVGKDAERQSAPHLHHVLFSPDGRFLLANDLGTDAIHSFQVNSLPPYLSAARSTSVSAGDGPRHSTWNADGTLYCLLNELSGTLETFLYQGDSLEHCETYLADTLQAGGSADIHFSPDGRFLYTSHRLKGEGIAVYAYSPETHSLRRVGFQPTASHPRNFNITPNGRYLLVACRDGNVIEVYERNPKSGLLTPTDKQIRMSKPVCIQWAE